MSLNKSVTNVKSQLIWFNSLVILVEKKNDSIDIKFWGDKTHEKNNLFLPKCNDQGQY